MQLNVESPMSLHNVALHWLTGCASLVQNSGVLKGKKCMRMEITAVEIVVWDARVRSV